jgi:hypothetical protein
MLKEIEVSGVGFQVSAIKKSQIPNYKYQMVRQAHHHSEPGRSANHNDRNSKFQTIDEIVKSRFSAWIPVFVGMTSMVSI